MKPLVPLKKPRAWLRTQQIVGYETGVANTVDPLRARHRIADKRD